MYKNLQACVDDLEATGRLVRINHPVDPYLELAAIQRRALKKDAPALLFTRVKGTGFPMLANIFGTRERIRYIFRDTLPRIEKLFTLSADPFLALKHPLEYAFLPRMLWHALPRKARRSPVFDNMCDVADLPALTSWPKDGGPFITLPQVYTESPTKPGFFASNLGMYRVQLGGNQYTPQEVGLHYQIHRGIGYHHAAAMEKGQSLPVNIFVGGPPAMTLAAILPSPENIPEILFAGMLANFRIPMAKKENFPLPFLAEADFCISGRIMPYTKPEGPFGDHLGYYSLTHDFPVLKVESVYYRDGAIWPFTSVGRPPQEDTMFGEIIHEITAPLLSRMFPGIHEVHAVDASGVHPLLLALGSERYTPFAPQKRPQELLTLGLLLLGSTQTSLSKFVLIAPAEDGLSTHNIPQFFAYMLERMDLEQDLHFITRTTMDTLDYSGLHLNQGSKVLMAAAGKARRVLGEKAPAAFSLPDGYSLAYFAKGILVLQGPPHGNDLRPLLESLEHMPGKENFPLVVLADDKEFTAASWDNFLWVTFTRADPAVDIHGCRARVQDKHWACEAPMLIDARIKPHHAPVLLEDPAIEKRIDKLGEKGGPLAGLV